MNIVVNPCTYFTTLTYESRKVVRSPQSIRQHKAYLKIPRPYPACSVLFHFCPPKAPIIFTSSFKIQEVNKQYFFLSSQQFVESCHGYDSK